MRLRLFRAPAMAEAMRRVRAELGEEAVILASRRVHGGVEVTAAVEPAAPEPEPAALLAPPAAPASLCAPPPLPEPAPADPLAAVLHRAGVPAPLAQALLAAAPRRGEAAARLHAALPARFAFAPLSAPAEPAALLLVGPAGAGKTLTTAKLATRAVLAGARPLVITADGARAGAAEQLAALLRVLGLPLVVAAHPGTLARALAARAREAPLLIDSAALDPHDAEGSEHLAALAAVAGAEPLLVLPAGLDAEEAAHCAATAAAIGARRLVATRLDVSRRPGGVLAAADAARLAFAGGGVGPGVADGLAALGAAELAALLLRDWLPRAATGVTAPHSDAPAAEAAPPAGRHLAAWRPPPAAPPGSQLP